MEKVQALRPQFIKPVVISCPSLYYLQKLLFRVEAKPWVGSLFVFLKACEMGKKQMCYQK